MTPKINRRGPCQVVPAETELPCTRRATPRRDETRSNLLPLCCDHYSEYVQQYLGYKASSRRVNRLYASLSRLVDGRDKHKELKATQRYIVALSEEIRERETHRKRYFIQIHGDGGHVEWENNLRKKLERATARMRQLCLCLDIEPIEAEGLQDRGQGPPGSGLGDSEWHNDLYSADWDDVGDDNSADSGEDMYSDNDNNASDSEDEYDDDSYFNGEEDVEDDDWNDSDDDLDNWS